MTRITYFNDRTVPARVFCGPDLHGDMKVLQPAEYGIFDLALPESDVIFIKVWENNVVFISSVPAAALQGGDK